MTLVRPFRVCVKLESPAPRARNVIAQGNALGENAYESSSAESAKWRLAHRNGWALKCHLDHYALSALGNLIELVPGPMAQAFTFRAFGAGKLTFDTASFKAGNTQYSLFQSSRGDN